MLLWFADLMNVTEEVTIHRPNVSTLLSVIRGDLNAATSMYACIGMYAYVGAYMPNQSYNWMG